jgi:hypothetical protein
MAFRSLRDDPFWHVGEPKRRSTPVSFAAWISGRDYELVADRRG